MRTPITIRDKSKPARPPCGVAIVVVIVAMVIALSLFAIWMKMIVQQRRRAAVRQNEAQAVRLAEAGVLRGIALRGSNPQYNGDTWSVDATTLGGANAAQVQIELSPSELAGRMKCRATADYPAGDVPRVRITREREFDVPNPGADS